ncbi:MAG: GntR family transcriptional regulator [Deltaproteobacteria bacterium]|nr:GntR family transcriptional regulator [Deltaproteobacteria bacterium]
MNKQNTTKKVFEEIRHRILSFQILPGVRLSDNELAKELGMSRTPVRQALFQLSEKGLVEARHNKGFRVRVFTLSDVEDLYLFREAVETLAVKRATAKMNQERAAILREHIAAYPQIIHSGDIIQFNKMDARFHHLIAEFSENHLLVKTISNLKDQLQIIVRYQHLAPHSYEETQVEHGLIMEHILAGRVDDAVKAMSDHILTSMGVVLEMMEKYGQTGGTNDQAD